MTIKELEEFRVICRRGSLAKASRELYMSPQGLSRVLKNLETELNCTLVNRVASGLELTESGECLREYAEIVLDEYDHLRNEVERIRASEEGTVNLLMAYDILRYLGPECIMDFQKIYPNVSFAFQEYPDRIVEKMLMEMKGNVALSIGPFVGECFHVYPLKKCNLGLLVYEGHPLAKQKEVSIEDIIEEPLCLENNNFKMNEFIQRKCWNKGFEPNIIFETNGFDLCYKMCRMKQGLSITVDFVHNDMKTEGLVMVPFAEKDMVWEMAILTPKEKTSEPAVEKFCKFIENRME